MFEYFLTFTAQVEVVAKNALVPDAYDAELIIAVGTNDFVDK